MITKGAACLTCRHWRRADIESDLASGQLSLRAVSRKYEIDSETLRRHAQRHLAPALREAMSGTAGFSAADIASRVLAAADLAHQIQKDASASGRDAIALRAVDSELRALAIVADRLGIEQGDAPAELELAGDVVRAVAHAARDSAEVADAVAAELRVLDRGSMADDL